MLPHCFCPSINTAIIQPTFDVPQCIAGSLSTAHNHKTVVLVLLLVLMAVDTTPCDYVL